MKKRESLLLIIKNIDDDVLDLIEKLEKEYPNFFFVELPEYHFKNVIEVKGDQKILFSGSFNGVLIARFNLPINTGM